ncbi:MAG: exosortase-associated EpsI family protein [Nitrosomonas sp.]|uniref:exosortase-associated EpsI family protein n=1 Tax=Nitrosomonas sp. TaxID=42353 RepID=UPI0032ED29B3
MRHGVVSIWVTVSNKAVLPGIEKKLQQLKYGLTGSVPDDMLVRVSTIDTDKEKAYRLQANFIQDLLSAIDTKDRIRLTGVFNEI